MNKNKFYTVTTEEGVTKDIYDGRYACVCAIVLAQVDEHLYVLANKRGPGCPDEVGKWNMPCGYLDAGSAEENCSREVYEETGVSIPADKFLIYSIGDTSESRNVTLRYVAVVDAITELPSVEDLAGLGGEKNEVAEIAWIPVPEIFKYEWAFGHENILVNLFLDILGFNPAD